MNTATIRTVLEFYTRPEHEPAKLTFTVKSKDREFDAPDFDGEAFAKIELTTNLFSVGEMVRIERADGSVIAGRVDAVHTVVNEAENTIARYLRAFGVYSEGTK